MNTAICPKPKKMSVRHSALPLDFSSFKWLSVAHGLSRTFRKAALRFCDETRLFFREALTLTSAIPVAGGIFLEVNRPQSGLPAQGYSLRCGRDGITLDCADEAGAFYGLQTLKQLLLLNGAHFFPFTISDSPDFGDRAFMLDVSRCKVPSMPTLLSFVDMLSNFKINQLQLYIEHTFAFSAHETVWRDSSPFTPAEIMELDNYCAERYIRLVPNFNSFGHLERWLKYPEYHYLAECPNGFEIPELGRKWTHGTTLKPDEQSLEFLDSLYREYLPVFSGDLFNVGCDETWELGRGKSKKLCKEKGKTRVYLDFLLKIHRLVSSHGRKMMFWGDIILHQPELIKELPEDIVALNWGYEAKHPFSKETKHFASADIPFYVCPGTSTWRSVTGRTENCIQNLANAARNGSKNGALGYLMTDWGDGGHHQYLPLSYMGILYGAAIAWDYRKNHDLDIIHALNDFVFYDPSGETARLFYDLGKSLEFFDFRQRNSAIFWNLLFNWDMKRPISEVLGGHEPERSDLKKCLEYLDSLEDRIPAMRPDTPDAEIIKTEAANAVAMGRHSLHRVLFYNGKIKDKTRLKRELRKIISSHESLWLARNRAGGLYESSGKLRELLTQLD